MPTWRIRFQAHNQRGETVVGITEEVISAPSSADAKSIISARYYGLKVTFFGISGPVYN